MTDFACGEPPLSSPQQAGGYPAKAFYEDLSPEFLILRENL